ncbi:peptide chain release factor N(5)-glutamine methyltransferase [Elongatibacter sediminis]|uniref:Release factor glutamine methyltransferase n=1 Tax=Elongatibacter sediminis TaxID=3119006 RepID=A0AAW9RHP6_9GAMM
MTIRDLLDLARGKLAASDSAGIDAELLLGHALEVKRSFLYANPGLDVPARRRSRFLELVRRRQQGEPIAYLIGRRPFWTLDLEVTPDVLIPRPETELLVECALERLPAASSRRVADLGTGSGAIALAIARERPACEVHATDCSKAALALAQRNARRHGLDRVCFHAGNWAEPLNGSFDLIVSNPPYVARDDAHLSTGDCRFEPEMALTPGQSGMEAFVEITATAGARLQAGGWLLLEHGFDQAEALQALLDQHHYREIQCVKDLAGHDRVCIARKH